MKKIFLFYFSLAGLALLFIWLILTQGRAFEGGGAAVGVPQELVHTQGGNQAEVFFKEFIKNLSHPLSIMILQIITIILFSRLLGHIFRRISQPMVIGEIFAGIILGPSVLGAFFPQVSAFLFPTSTLSNLQFLSQIGLMLFMFIIGMELDITILKKRAAEAVLLSHSSIALSYLLGVGLSYFIYTEYAPANISFTSFALFIGVAMSIMAFPVLARIMQERNLTRTPLGYLTLTTAAVDDITAWCILALVIAVVKAGTLLNAAFTIFMVILYVLFMLKLLQPLLSRLGRLYITRESPNKTFIAFIFAILLFSSFLTEVIGIHALFGAFLAGVIIPNELNFKSIIAEKIEDLSLILLLPLFFVFTGLRTQVGLINHPEELMMCAVIIALAVAGKFSGSLLAARYLKLPWKNALSLGVLMNTRGLMELVVVNIGYDLGVIGPEIFAMLVIMAMVTTFMTGPLMELIEYVFRKKEPAAVIKRENRILVSFGRPETGTSLLKLVRYLSVRNGDSSVRVLHITPRSDISFQDSVIEEIQETEPVEDVAERLGLKAEVIRKSTGKIKKEILSVVEEHGINLLLLGRATTVFTGNALGGKIKYLMDRSPCDVGVFIDNNFELLSRALFIIENREDLFLLKYSSDVLISDVREVMILDRQRITEVSEFISKLPAGYAKKTRVKKTMTLDEKHLSEYNLVVMSEKFWAGYSENLMRKGDKPCTSVLILKEAIGVSSS